MSDDKPRDTPQAPTPDDETQPVRAEGPPVDEPAATPAPEPAPTPTPTSVEPAERRGFRDRLRRTRTSEDSRSFSLGALIASALAGVIVGGLGGAALHAVNDDGPRHEGPWVQRWDHERGPGFGGRDGMHLGPGFPGQMQPTTPPEDDGSDS
jgi:hypothetical protein